MNRTLLNDFAMIKKTAAVCILTFLSLKAANADDLTITVNFTVLETPCTVNSGNPISVSFGDEILTTSIVGDLQKKDIAMTFNCAANNYTGKITIVPGAISTFDENAIATNIAGLAIKVNLDDNRVRMNEAHVVDLNTAPKYEAVLLKDPSVALQPGKFTASATFRLTVD
ncbi:fimbrial protein [Enterobacter sp. 168J2]|uniref:fimbrial protein n=1 Tax=Enterobacter sp. 168J2 TaxID=3077758 RepID=UPI00209D3C59|nr:fimbrial protein [Enterobacter sp. 168J2]MCP1115436.1 fimbrial protein [Enterobacter bugandensis]HBU6132875.1 fimbrial protein [Enterobacter cloacae]